MAIAYNPATGGFEFVQDTVPQVTALRAIPSSGLISGEIFFVEGTNAPADGGGGMFSWSPTSTASDDSATIIKPNDIALGAPGRWLLNGGATTNALTSQTAALSSGLALAETQIAALQQQGQTGGTIYNSLWSDVVTNTASWDSATAYVASQTMVSQGAMWVALQANTNQAPPTLPVTANAYWELFRNPYLGQTFIVASTDTGTHTDPATGAANTPNSGVFAVTIGTAGTGPSYLYPTDAALAATSAAASAASAAEADGARDTTIAALPDIHTTEANQAMGLQRSADANPAISYPGRISSIGNLLLNNFVTGARTMGLYDVPESFFEFSRASTGEAIGGGNNQNFATGVRRIFDSRLYLDSGGTNLLLYSEDLTQTVWTKTNTTIISSTALGPAGNSATRVEETATTGNHEVRQTVTGTGLTWTYSDWLQPGEVSIVQILLASDSASNQGGRADFILSGNGSVANVFGVGGLSNSNVVATIWYDPTVGYYYVSITATLTETPAHMVAYERFCQSLGVISYPGTVGHGLWRFGSQLQFASLPSSYIKSVATQGTRAIEAYLSPLSIGNYLRLLANEMSTSLTAIAISASGTRDAPSSPNWLPWLTQITYYNLTFYDVMNRANTSNGSIGVATDGGVYTLYNGYTGTYPLPIATAGQLLNNWVTITPVSGSLGTLYAVRDIGAGQSMLYASVSARFGAGVSGADPISNTSITILFSASANLIDVMPVHLVLTRSGLVMERRNPDGSFTTIGIIGVRLATDNSAHQFGIALHPAANTAIVTIDNQSIVVQDSGFSTACRYVCWEINTTSNHTTDLGQFQDCFATSAEVGTAPAYTASAPVVTSTAAMIPSSPPTFTSGCTLSATAQPALVNSNAGAVTITGFQWYRNGVAISGATSGTWTTTAGTDSGATFYCAITYQNNVGSVTANSAVTPALA